jgi:putative FmdB family regulatory protein
LYEYKCKVCDEYFEVEQSFSEDTLATIAGCTVDESGQHQVKKIFAAPAISFKGGGFYRNDARPSDGGSKSSSKSSNGKTSTSSSDD